MNTFIKIFFVCFILLTFPFNLIFAATNSWRDTSYFSENPKVAEVSRGMMQTGDIPKISYVIDLGKTENKRIIINNIDVKTQIDNDNDRALELIRISYIVDDRTNPSLIGEKVVFYLGPFESQIQKNNVNIVSIMANGWTMNDNIATSSVAIIRNSESQIFSDEIFITISIDNQSLYKGRKFELLNRDIVNFDLAMEMSDKGFEFSQFNYTLPYRLKTDQEARSYPDLFSYYNDSIVLNKNMVGNKMSFSVQLKGEDYWGTNSYSGLVPEKIIYFGYTYNYQRSERATTNIAIWLFAISVLISFIPVITRLVNKFYH